MPYKRRRAYSVLALSVWMAVLAVGCSDADSENQKFEAYTEHLFCREVSGNTISLHYTLKNPRDYGIHEIPVTFGTFEESADAKKAEAENMRSALLEFDYGQLDLQNRITYEVLNDAAGKMRREAEYLLYEEPLGTVNGIQTQLPVVLSEYRFYDREDVETYLGLLREIDPYFEDLIRFEQQKAAAGLFMSDRMAEIVQEQCRAFLDMGNSHYLYSTFVDRMEHIQELTEKEKSEYIQENAGMIQDYVFPAYEKLYTAIDVLKGCGKNDGGLAHLPEGKAYYELTAKCITGLDMSIRELEDMARRQIGEDLEDMEQVLGLTGEEAVETSGAVLEASAVEKLEQSERMSSEGLETDPGSAGKAEEGYQGRPELEQSSELLKPAGEMLSVLKEKTAKTFPEAPDTSLEIKCVPKEMEEHLSPAFYMIPAIDATEENVIYINRAHMGDELTLFTTLAHEGYPGHLYQTIYYEGTDPDPVRSIISYGGYVEGWATYAEMCSYYLTNLTKEQAVLMQKNASIILGLYAPADMGIHYEGWSRMDMAEFFSDYGIRNAEMTDQIYDLILGSPGNYLQYYFGYVSFLELKKDWVEEYGDSFSQAEFHEGVLGVGPAPFEIVKRYMWEVADAE